MWDADSGMAKISKGKIILIFCIKKSDEKLNRIIICVNNIANAETGFIVEICEPTLWTILWEKIKAPSPIKNDPKIYNIVSFTVIILLKKPISKFKYGEYIPTIEAVRLDPSAKAAKHPKNIRLNLIW